MFIQCTVHSVKRAKETPLEYISEMYINPFNKNRGFVRHEFVLLTDRLSLEFIVKGQLGILYFLRNTFCYIHQWLTWILPHEDNQDQIPFLPNVLGIFTFQTHLLIFLGFLACFSSCLMFPGAWQGGERRAMSGRYHLWKSARCFFFSGWGGKWIISEAEFVPWPN